MVRIVIGRRRSLGHVATAGGAVVLAGTDPLISPCFVFVGLCRLVVYFSRIIVRVNCRGSSNRRSSAAILFVTTKETRPSA